MYYGKHVFKPHETDNGNMNKTCPKGRMKGHKETPSLVFIL